MIASFVSLIARSFLVSLSLSSFGLLSQTASSSYFSLFSIGTFHRLGTEREREREKYRARGKKRGEKSEGKKNMWDEEQLEMLQRRLRPFRPKLDLQLSRVPFEADEVLGEVVDLAQEYNFKPNSLQHNFFLKSPPKRTTNVVYVLHSSHEGVPTTLDAPTVVARLFGRLRGNDELEIWHLSVQKSHPLNDSKQGTRWGLYGIRLDSEKSSKSRWYDAQDLAINKRNSEVAIRGTPNPYATMCLYEVVKSLNLRSARQHEAMPCAQLFDPQYDHRSHPATQLVYRALHFRRPPGLDFYAWDRDSSPSMESSWAKCLHRMHYGIPVVFQAAPSLQDRRPPLEGGAMARLCNCSFAV